ncbi:MAG: DEAD/DEAH box helicase [Acidimicrobiales bacterium]|jgi:ATP-dependent RNA helicase DeaD|nr:DEAD/DEAH box helicase [Acidimicrobiales bacterium]
MTDDHDEPAASTERAAATDPRSFADLGVAPELVAALADLGYEEPTPIQAEAIPVLLDGADLLGQAATGTGKTAAFALPVLQLLAHRQGRDGADERGRRDVPLALVLVPTRELAMQVSEALHRYGRNLGARVLPVFGGQPIGRQLQALARGVDVVVATPGRAIDHMRRGTLDLGAIEVVVLDEADEMLDMGFAEDLTTILDETPERRQTVLFSATMPARIASLARRHLRDPVRIEIERPSLDTGEAPQVRQVAFVVSRAHKPAALARVLDVEAPVAALVFCRTRTEVDQLTETLNGRGYRAEALHGGLSQEQRDRVMGRLRAGTADLLVATDVAARGLDVPQLTHVVNYDVPSAPESYVHRVGRVGRAGRAGVAITLAEPREHRLLKNIERVTRQRLTVEKLPTVADLHARRLELTRATLREVLLEGDLDRVRVVVETLADEFDVMEIALAAVTLAHEAQGAGVEEEEIPDVAVRPPRDDRDRAGKPGKPGKAGKAGKHDKDRSTGKGAGHGKEGKAGKQGKAGKGRKLSDAVPVARIYIGAGRGARVRPQDLVGAITGETHLSGRDIGSIEITERFSLVEVPEADAPDVIDALRRTRIKGNKVPVRRDRGHGHDHDHG